VVDVGDDGDIAQIVAGLLHVRAGTKNPGPWEPRRTGPFFPAWGQFYQQGAAL